MSITGNIEIQSHSCLEDSGRLGLGIVDKDVNLVPHVDLEITL